jgi:Ca2+/Na+ antiporter
MNGMKPLPPRQIIINNQSSFSQWLFFLVITFSLLLTYNEQTRMNSLVTNSNFIMYVFYLLLSMMHEHELNDSIDQENENIDAGQYRIK